MSHVVVIIQRVILPPPDSQVTAAHSLGDMTAEVRYTPPHNATDAQIGDQVERIVKRLGKLADD